MFPIKAYRRPSLLALVLALTACTSLAQKNKPYHEDLSKLHPKVEMPDDRTARKDSVIKNEFLNVTPARTVNAKVNSVLDSLDLFNLMRKYIDGFTIQIYSGQKREDAMNTKKKLMEEVPDLNANLQYQQPKFRVTVGKYFTRLEAQRDLLTLRRKFSAAILVPEKIPVK